MSRRNAREAALQALFQLEFGQLSALEALSYALGVTALTDKDEGYARLVLAKAVQKWEKTEALITEYAEKWSLERLARVDRAILRLSIAEMLLNAPDTPVGVVIDEGLELAKEYSTDESSRFIHGILGSVASSLGWVEI
ncbi:MAG: N utilization substance protein B [Firmicutes bacterium]|nr:N utilization substance protein B [Bacillota bacterium]